MFESHCAEGIFKRFLVSSRDHARHRRIASGSDVTLGLSEGITDVKSFSSFGFNE